MRSFFDDRLFLKTEAAYEIYKAVKDLPIIDYHCHLDERAIAEDRRFADIGELWLAGDHYKWRAMRLSGVSERLITGDATFKEKFMAYAAILPRLIGNPLYYWTHMELKAVFGIEQPLNADTAEEIYNKANERLATLSVRKLLDRFDVRFLATTDDPESELAYHGTYGNTVVSPTFRPDRCFAEGMDKRYLEKRLDYFVSRGCKIADHGFDNVAENTADLEWLMAACHERDMLLQLHFGTFRNINSRAFATIGRDSGYDVMRGSVDTDAVARLLDKMASRDQLPRTVLYSLNDTATRTLSAISGGFPRVLIGAAWWFNDTASGIRRHLDTVAEYAALGTSLGMLTDSRSFSSYPRFEFFRRLLADYIGDKVTAGEYDAASAVALARDICYGNVSAALGLQ